ncbi:MAG: ATP-binding cassette domain-containing protein, partial [Bermanella sp.]
SCLLLFIFQQKYMARYQGELNSKQKSHFKNIDELLRSSKSLLADNRFQSWQKNPAGQNFNDSSCELKVLESRFKTCFVAIKWGLQLTLPTVGGILLLNNEITTGVLLAALIIGYRGLIPFEVILGQWQLSSKLLTLYSSWQAQCQQKKNSQSKPTPITSLSGNLMVDDLSIKFNDQYRYLLKSVNVCVKPGEALAIIGANGSGKTLLIDSLVGVGLSHSGNIYFDEYNRHLVDETWLGDQIGYVPQNLSLATASIQQVICRYQFADIDRVVEVAKQIAVHKYILSLPMGYDTQVGLYGENMPPGILQRILIASALYVKPRYLFFDEADAYLDQEGQQVFRKLIVSLKQQGLTVIFATQKRSMVDVADGVLLMDGGEARYASSVDGLSMGLIRGQA